MHHEREEGRGIVAVAPVDLFEQLQAFGAEVQFQQQRAADQGRVGGYGYRQSRVAAAAGIRRVGDVVPRPQPVFGEGAAAVVAGQRGRGHCIHAGDEVPAPDGLAAPSSSPASTP